MKPTRVQTEATRIAWDAYRDQDTYHPLRDGPRKYSPVWVVERQSRYLPPEHVQLARELLAMFRLSRGGYAASDPDLERICAGVDLVEMEARQMQRGGFIRDLEGYQRAAFTRVGDDGQACYFGIIEGDGQAELARRAGYPESSVRAVRRLVQITLEALSNYRDENESAPARWNAY